MAEIIDLERPREHRVSDGSDGECDHDPHFSPIVSLPEVEVSTNEENEVAMLTLRAKLYRFDTSSEPSEWKERGTGEMKLLRHKETNAMRIVMRRDKTFKVCANHFITPWMTLKPCCGSERAFIYTVPADFADEKPKSECLAIKFGSVDNANVFKEKFEEAKEIAATVVFDNFNEDSDDDDDSESGEEKAEDESAKVAEKLSLLDVNKDDVVSKQENDEKEEVE